MSDTSTIPAISGSTTVGVPIEKAFRVFTSSFNTWWPREFHIGRTEMAEAILQPREGGIEAVVVSVAERREMPDLRGC